MGNCVIDFNNPKYGKAFLYVAMLMQHLQQAIANGQEFEVRYEAGTAQGEPADNYTTFKFDGSLDCRFRVKPLPLERQKDFFLNKTNQV